MAMNERIEELAEGCFEYIEGTLDGDIVEFNYKKFAELIIRECVGIADDYVKDCTCEEHVNCKHPRSAIGKKIRKHFGV